ncbi:hypothetical protein [Propionivibrio sp.]|uniref:hypothetical protein n=1 Tax=Propionivibrio sp. TaxID=2212460 RepID=UPI003BF42C5B
MKTLKPYLTISEAAAALSKSSDVPLTDRDVFDLVAARRITLLARFNEPYPAQLATVTPSENPDLSERVDYGDSLPGGVRGVFPLWLGAFDRPFVNSTGEFQSEHGCLHFGTAKQGTLIVIEAATLPPGAEWLVSCDALRELLK